jgi:hypothetical protein
MEGRLSFLSAIEGILSLDLASAWCPILWMMMRGWSRARKSDQNRRKTSTPTFIVIPSQTQAAAVWKPVAHASSMLRRARPRGRRRGGACDVAPI